MPFITDTDLFDEDTGQQLPGSSTFTGTRGVVGVPEELQKPRGLGTDWAKKVREMRDDPTISLVRHLVSVPIISAPWTVEVVDEEFKESEEHEEQAEWIEKNAIDPYREHIVSNGLRGFFDFGYAPFEVIWQVTEESLIAPRKIKPLIQDNTFCVVDSGTGAFLGLEQDNIFLDHQESLLLNHDVEGTNWYGWPIMKGAEQPYDSSQIVNESADKYDQKVAGSHWIIHYPIGTSPYKGTDTDNFEIARDLLSSLKGSGSIVVPDLLRDKIQALNAGTRRSGQDDTAWRIELVSDTANVHAGFVDRSKYLDALKVRGLGWPERAILEGEFGTKAEAATHADFAMLALDLINSDIARQINWHYVNKITRQNWGHENVIAVKTQPSTDEAVEYLRNIYEKIITNQAGLLDELVQIDTEVIRDRLGIPSQEAQPIF